MFVKLILLPGTMYKVTYNPCLLPLTNQEHIVWPSMKAFQIVFLSMASYNIQQLIQLLAKYAKSIDILRDTVNYSTL